MSPVLETFANASVRGYGAFLPSTASATYELISTTLLGSATGTITFSSIPQTYKHLQIRTSARASGFTGQGQFRFNGDASNSYRYHNLEANGSSTSNYTGATTSFMTIPNWVWGNTQFNNSVIDILDYTATTKNKTVKALNGRPTFPDGNQTISLTSNVWLNTSAISSITIFLEASGTFAANSRISLYGIMGV